MRLLTFQDTYTLDSIKIREEEKKTPMYTCNTSFFYATEEVLALELGRRMREAVTCATNENNMPIWCWVVPSKQEIDEEYLKKLYFRHKPNAMITYAIEMKVPDKYILLSNYDIWCELMMEAKDNKVITMKNINRLFEKQKGATLQACIPFIHKSFITKTTLMEEWLTKDFSETDDDIEKLRESGAIVNDEIFNLSVPPEFIR